MTEQESDRGFAGQLRRLGPVLGGPGEIDVRDEVVGVGACEHEYLARAVCLDTLNQGDEVTDEFGPRRFIGGAAISAKRTARWMCTVSVSKVDFGRDLSRYWKRKPCAASG